MRLVDFDLFYLYPDKDSSREPAIADVKEIREGDLFLYNPYSSDCYETNKLYLCAAAGDAYQDEEGIWRVKTVNEPIQVNGCMEIV